MTKTSWVAKVGSNKERLFFLSWTPKESHQLIWYFVNVPLAREQEMLQKWNNNEALELSDYGEVLHWGYDKPPDQIIDSIRKQYGFRYDI